MNQFSSFLRNLILKLAPPFFSDFLKKFLRNRSIYIKGQFDNWSNVPSEVEGYNFPIILNKVLSTTRDVVANKIPAERDSFPLTSVNLPAPLLFIISKILINSKECHVLDFGGALGTHYREVNFFLASERLQWSVVEQDSFVNAGKEFENSNLKFFNSIDDAFNSKGQINIALFSSVLQYLKSPTDILSQVSRLNCQYLIIDRTPFSQLPQDHLAIQYVPKWVYGKSLKYPIRIFRKKELFDRELELKLGYLKWAEFRALDKLEWVGKSAKFQPIYQGSIYRRM